MKNALESIKEIKNEKCFYHYNPLYFLGKLNDWGLFEFNPYLDEYYENLYNFSDFPSEFRGFTVKSNPGMTLECGKDYSGNYVNYNGKKFAGINGFFNQDYSNLDGYKKTGYKKYFHEGVDFRGPAGTDVISLIQGKIIKQGKRPNNKGGVIVIQSLSDPTLYFFALHVDENSFIYKENDYIFPLMAICKTMKMDAPHLHVSAMRLSNEEFDINKIIRSNFTLGYFDKINWKYTINPFENGDLNNNWKGWSK